MLNPGHGADRCGLAILQRQGLAAWLRGLVDLPGAACAVEAADPPPRPEVRDEAVIEILLSIVRQRIQQEGRQHA